MLVEIVCQSVQDAKNATSGGAGRLELCSALPLGGLTPTVGLLTAVKSVVSVPVMAMVRPRPGGFVHSPEEIKVMLADARLLLQNGADGIVFGCLTEEGRIDREACRQLIELASGHETVFHRAFDLVADPFSALEALIELGVTRILTSGGKATAVAGSEQIKTLIDHSAGRIEILPGGGIRASNVRQIISETGATQVHLAPLIPIPETFPFDLGTQTVVDTLSVEAVIRA